MEKASEYYSYFGLTSPNPFEPTINRRLFDYLKNNRPDIGPGELYFAYAVINERLKELDVSPDVYGRLVDQITARGLVPTLKDFTVPGVINNVQIDTSTVNARKLLAYWYSYWYPQTFSIEKAESQLDKIGITDNMTYDNLTTLLMEDMWFQYTDAKSTEPLAIRVGERDIQTNLVDMRRRLIEAFGSERVALMSDAEVTNSLQRYLSKFSEDFNRISNDAEIEYSRQIIGIRNQRALDRWINDSADVLLEKARTVRRLREVVASPITATGTPSVATALPTPTTGTAPEIVARVPSTSPSTSSNIAIGVPLALQDESAELNDIERRVLSDLIGGQQTESSVRQSSPRSASRGSSLAPNRSRSKSPSERRTPTSVNRRSPNRTEQLRNLVRQEQDILEEEEEILDDLEETRPTSSNIRGARGLRRSNTRSSGSTRSTGNRSTGNTRSSGSTRGSRRSPGSRTAVADEISLLSEGETPLIVRPRISRTSNTRGLTGQDVNIQPSVSTTDGPQPATSTNEATLLRNIANANLNTPARNAGAVNTTPTTNTNLAGVSGANLPVAGFISGTNTGTTATANGSQPRASVGRGSLPRTSTLPVSASLPVTAGTTQTGTTAKGPRELSEEIETKYRAREARLIEDWKLLNREESDLTTEEHGRLHSLAGEPDADGRKLDIVAALRRCANTDAVQKLCRIPKFWLLRLKNDFSIPDDVLDNYDTNKLKELYLYLYQSQQQINQQGLGRWITVILPDTDPVLIPLRDVWWTTQYPDLTTYTTSDNDLKLGLGRELRKYLPDLSNYNVDIYNGGVLRADNFTGADFLSPLEVYDREAIDNSVLSIVRSMKHGWDLVMVIEE